MGRYILCIDNGLTTTKCVLFTLEGREIAACITNTIVESKDAFSEIDMELQWKNTALVIRQTMDKSGIDPSDIVGIGNSGHGAGLYCLDDKDRPVRKAVTSMDSRALTAIEKWSGQGKSTFPRLYQNLWSGQAVPILSWLKKNENDSYKKIKRILMVKDWIIFNLTGEAGIEYTDASNNGLINPVEKNTDKEVMELFDIEDVYEKIPKLRKTIDVAGHVTKAASIETGLKIGTPVMGGVFDVIACAMGSGVYENDKYSLIAGTWNINSAIEEKLIRAGETIKCSLFTDIDRYLYVESSATSAVNLEWYADRILRGFGAVSLSNKELYMKIDEEVGKIRPDESNIIYMPFLYKSHLSRNLDGCFFGIKPQHNTFNMLRAIFEGVAFAHKKHLENLQKGGLSREKAVLSGGASNSGMWSQMFADVLNMEVVTTQASQVGALGMAVCAAVAVGEYKDFREAIRVMVREKETYYPNKENYELYFEKYKEFNNIINKFDKE